MSGRVRSFLFPGPAGNLEGLWKDPEGTARGSAVVGHPHPLHGGTLHSKVVFRVSRALSRGGFGVLRFNFRGVGLSQGGYDSSRGETGDFRAAMDEAISRGGAPLIAGGFSFGAAVGLRAVAGDGRVRAFIGVGIPFTSEVAADLPRPHVPALFVVGALDTIGPAALLREWVRGSGRVVEIPGADHFFEGRLDELEAAVARFLVEVGIEASA